MSDTMRSIYFFGKEYHWTYNRFRVLILHRGSPEQGKCHRVHYNNAGGKIV